MISLMMKKCVKGKLAVFKWSKEVDKNFSKGKVSD